MSRIRILDPRVAEQIAAGEVVDRPASVVKELVENSIDAGSSSIRIEVSGAGVEEIRVLDDGEGMEADDLLIALKRHATSKLRRVDELSRLTTLGFRGEALPSIASVSKLTLESSPGESGEGFRVRVEGGEAGPLEAVGHPRGTTVTVRSLFYNAPARRKFLRSPGTERDSISEQVSRIALAHFDRRFALAFEGKTAFEASPASGRGDRIRQIFGEATGDRLLPFTRALGGHRVSGFTSRPDFTRSTTRDQALFVNGRPIRDRGILHAISSAYATLLPRGRHPFVILFLEVPPDRVDVNVHPAKAEVRLADPRGVHEAVRLALRSALDEERPIPSLQRVTSLSEPSPDGTGEELLFDGFRGKAAIDKPPVSCDPDPSPQDAVLLFGRGGGLGTIVPLAQYRESYILAADEQGLLIVDQHVAHERILYEEILEDADRAQIRRQALLFPVNVDARADQARRLEEGKGELERLGFRLEAFGERSYLIREVPAQLGNADPAALLLDLADEMGEAGTSGGGSAEAVRHRLAATTACHAAVKVNFPLTREKMIYLLEGLSRTATPMTCPHGRPIVLRLTHLDLEREFHRR